MNRSEGSFVSPIAHRHRNLRELEPNNDLGALPARAAFGALNAHSCSTDAIMPGRVKEVQYGKARAELHRVQHAESLTSDPNMHVQLQRL